MSINVAESFNKVNTLAELMVGREKGTTEFLLGKEVTINDIECFDIPNNKGEMEMQVIFVTKEYPQYFFFGGYAIRKWFLEMLSKTDDGDVDQVYDAVRTQPIKVIASQGRTREGNTITKWTMVK